MTARSAAGLIQYSDQGAQYYCNIYTEKLRKRMINISMTEEKHCYENIIAKGANKILEDKFYRDKYFFSKVYANRNAKDAIDIYNNKKLHLPLGHKTPNMI